MFQRHSEPVKLVGKHIVRYLIFADFARLALLRPQLSTERLTTEEISVVTSYLTAEIMQVRQFYRLDPTKIRDLVSNASVMTLMRKSKTPNKPEQEDILIRQGKLLTTFLLILNGKVTILVGKDQFHVEKGSWTVLGADVLTMPEGTYLPDFTAFITSDQARVIILNPFVHTNDVNSSRKESPLTTDPDPSMK